jgi:hypothetical protein
MSQTATLDELNSATSRSPMVTVPRGAKTRVEATDFNRVVDWSDPDYLEDAMGEIAYLIAKPPLRSVVAKMSPALCAELLKVYNLQNRRIKRGLERNLGATVKTGNFELTGDTIKFSKTGTILDGQHRLKSSATSKEPITTHIVFGLEPQIFDVLDQGYKRTPSDVLQLAGIKDATMVAAAMQWIETFETRLESNRRRNLTPRDMRERAEGDYKAVAECCDSGRLIHKMQGYPPSVITAVVYMITKRSPALAKEFVQDWAFGSRVGRALNFNTLKLRLQAVEKQSGGRLDHRVRAAMIVQTFNAWNAGITATPQMISWNIKRPFPAFMFDAREYLRKREILGRDDLNATQKVVYAFFKKSRDENGDVQLPYGKIAEGASEIDADIKVGPSNVANILKVLQNSSLIRLINHPTTKVSGKYHVLSDEEIIEARRLEEEAKGDATSDA